MRGLGEEEREREEPRGGESEERLEREEETGGDAEERVAAAARGHREVERRSGGRDRSLEGEDGEPPLADGVAGRALDLGKRGRARAGKERERVMGLFWVRVWGRPKAGAGFVSARTNFGCLIQIRGPDHTQP